ncbi:MAG TPA: hypothetical protein PLV06_11885 [Bacteroidales bacterium]|nr:hypothetical protein [Bacteroidales bacterium]HPF03018.1 hypothetical protein [Bacteroidales bacterium]HPJ59957.1 hypothetical protein [Bacteroidales bacterium]HPR13078.1 hypothetical protein [Bacteroidales bacterium]HRW85698.1 hypothetical protein [Bacteroidales bacterium]
MTWQPEYRRILHRMGYYSYQDGLIRRHNYQSEGWLNHERKCREFILEAFDNIRPSTVTVLGSGWLMELPLAELAERCSLIRLVDIFHPPEVKKQTAAMGNVELVEDDVSGGIIREVWEKTGKRTFFNRPDTLQSIEIPVYNLPDDTGMLISLNILTQLEILPERLLRRKTGAGEDEFAGFRKSLQQNHLALLKKFRSVLISDSDEIITDRQGNRSERKTMLVSPEQEPAGEWIWDFDVSGYDSSIRKSLFRVRAFLL